MEPVRLENQWCKRLRQLEWPDKPIQFYRHFLADSTRRQYNKYIEDFRIFCVNKFGCFPPLDKYASAAIAEFITYKSESSERPESMLRGIMAALSNYYSIQSINNPLTQEVRNLAKALVKCNTVRNAGRTKIMSLEPFAEMFKAWEPNDSLTIEKLRQKAITLMAISCIARPSDFAPSVGFFRDQVIFNGDGSATVHFFGVKNDYDRTGFEIRIEPTEDNHINPVECIKIYFSKTANIPTNKKGRTPVFPALKPPFQGISSQSIAQILNHSIKEAGLDTKIYSAKCFRPSAATAAIVSGCEPNTTRMRGRWKNNDVFFSNYVFPISENNISNTILTSNVKL